MKDLCGDYRDERRQGAGKWEALVASIRFWVDDLLGQEDPEARPKDAGAPVLEALTQRAQ